MAEARRYGLTPQLDIQQIQTEAHSRWLRPVEICEILKNYQGLQISPEPPNRPPSGSLFLFDRKVLRYFRKDGHNWRKKRDGKTVKEAHEKLKAGSVDVLHCYYAHGEENQNFQRRTYWMLEEEFMHIVLVHYREVKDKKETYGRTRDVADVTRNLYDDRPVGSNSSINYHQILSSNADGESQNSGQTSEYEDAEQDTTQASSRYHPVSEFGGFDGHPLTNINHVNYYSHLQQSIGGYDPSQRQMAPGTDIFSVSQEDTIYDNSGFGVAINRSKTDAELPSWDTVWKQCAPNFSDVAFPAASSGLSSVDDFQRSITVILDEGSADGLAISQETITDSQGNEEWQELAHVAGIPKEANFRYASLMKQLSLDFPNVDGEKGLQKHDSFSKWITRELDDVDDKPKPSTRLIWDVVEGENGVEDSCLSPQQDLEYLMSPSLSQDQLFSINYVTPGWAFADSETTVFVSGTFLTRKEDIQKVKWSCMFGQNEVCAEAIGDGLLRCLTPIHKPGRIPFYVTRSNRLACSEVREFEFYADDDQTIDSNNETLLYLRLERLLSSSECQNQIPPLDAEKISLCNKISSLLTESNYCLTNIPRKGSDEEFTSDAKDEMLQKFLIEKLHQWLLQKVTEDGKGPNVIDKEGQGVIHLAAALDYDWAIAPVVAAGVNINFRDARGWTALHWAAAFGREKTIVALLSMDADPGLLTDPTPEFPSGRTPADLSSSNGHKGIAGFLAESSLTKHLSNLDLKESEGRGIAGNSNFVPGDNSEQTSNQFPSEDLQSQQSLNESLGAVRNSIQAYARIFQVYRMQSFHRKRLVEYEHSTFGGMPEEEALSLIATKANKVGQRDDPMHAAATRIQNKFRGWKGRKDFLVIRQHIVKIQAHIRGYQVRKHYRKVVWSVLIVEKAILRWRRKGSGLRGFRSEGPSSEVAGAQVHIQPDNNKEDDYEYLREGRKQTEARLQRALARVKSMVQYPDARDQYKRLVEGVKESKKVMLERILSETEETNDDLMFDIDELVAEDAYMSTT